MATSAVAVSLAASAAAQAANAEHISRCTRTEMMFNAKTATIEQKLDYADCVQFLYPVHNTTTGAKLIIGSFLIAFILGCIYGAIKERDLMGAVMYGIIGIAFLLGVALFALTIGFLFS